MFQRKSINFINLNLQQGWLQNKMLMVSCGAENQVLLLYSWPITYC